MSFRRFHGLLGDFQHFLPFWWIRGTAVQHRPRQVHFLLYLQRVFKLSEHRLRSRGCQISQISADFCDFGLFLWILMDFCDFSEFCDFRKFSWFDFICRESVLVYIYTPTPFSAISEPAGGHFSRILGIFTGFS